MKYSADAMSRLASEGADTIAFFGWHGERFAAEASAAVAPSPSRERQLSYLNGLTADGTLTARSFWGDNGQTAFKWGETIAGTGTTISYVFDAAAGFTATEKTTFVKAFAMWAAVADITFTEGATDGGAADVLLVRGRDGGAYNSQATSAGSGATLGSVLGQSLISIDTSTMGFDLSGSFTKVGGYGLATVIHEVGHLLGLGHGGDYNGAVDPSREQYSAYDDRMYTTMSYISWIDEDARLAARNPVQGTDWGRTTDGYERQSPHSVMMLDIAAIQQLYGVARTTPFDGGETYGFNATVTGSLAPFFDFTQNKAPIVTLYNQGSGNTLDLSGFRMDQVIDLAPGAFSSVGGLTNNVAVALDTAIETAIGGSGKDTIYAGDVASALFGGRGDDTLHGGAGKDALTGGRGADVFRLDDPGDTGKTAKTADRVTDFASSDGDRIDLSAIDAVPGGGDDAFTFIGTAAFGRHAGELRYEIRGDVALVAGDVSGDGKADFMLRLDQVDALVAADFRL